MMKPILIGETDPDICLVQATDEMESEMLQKEYEKIAEGTDRKILLAAFLVDDWNRDLSPWEAPAAFGKENFGGRAGDTLSYLKTKFLPYVKQERCVREDAEWIVGGYSLSGLFALWAACETDLFRAAAAASPSVWFPGWTEYVKSCPDIPETVYLSLGTKEERTKNPVMRTVGDRIREMHHFLKESGKNTVLEWNPGNHFQDPDGRMAKGFLWCIEHA